MTERRTYAPGTWVWVPDDEIVWRKTEVMETFPNGEMKVKTEDGFELSIKPNVPTHLCNVEVFSSDGLMGLDDLTHLTHLHEAAVLNSLNIRFDVDKIYTLTGPILIAVNPFKTIPMIYDNTTIKHFLEASEQNPQSLKRAPHVFGTGSVAFRGLCDTKSSQTILISGESGAGKTESTKFVMKLLALAGSEDWNNRSQIENQVLQSNPLLEALGNARTLRNDNSSRYGKFIEMQFRLQGKRGTESLVGRLAGARIHTYLLETVRVCHQLEGERNYHSFYQLCAAAAAAGESRYYTFPNKIADKVPGTTKQVFDLSKFESYEKFRYLTKSSCSKLDKVDDVEEFENTVLAMQTIGISIEEQISFWNVVGAVLYLGNIQFKVPSENSEGSAIRAECRSSLELAANLLQVSVEVLEKALTFRTITARADVYEIPLKLREADDARDGLAKALYGTAFLKIVKKTNESIGYHPDVKLFCGVLDIFGFECFQYNSFEQLCINFTNERLQQFFNDFIFKCEEELYKKEGISWCSLDFPDNADCVDIIDRKSTGIFAMLDEECIVPGGSDKGFCNKMKDKHKYNKRFEEIKKKPEWFIVIHFAGPVSYCVDGFLDKNRDQLSINSQDCIKQSSSEFVRSLFIEFLNRGGAEDKGSKKRNYTVSSEFRSQLNYLMETVRQTSPHFIRCIKPNPRNVPDEFERKAVTEQLRYGGVLQAVQVSRAGYPVRLLHHEAYLDYRHLCSKEIFKAIEKEDLPDKKRASMMLVHLDEQFQFPKPAHSAKSWSVGQTLVFFKHESYEVLSSELAALRVSKAIFIQSRWKGKQQMRFYKHLRRCSTIIQTHIRSALARRRAQRIREERAARRIQDLIRRFLARKAFLRIRSDIITIQSAWRGYRARLVKAGRKRHVAATRIQSSWKGYKSRTYYTELRRGALTAQLRWRQILAKRQLRRLKLERREAASLLVQKQKLQDENKSLRSKVEETEVRLIIITSEKDRLAARVNELEKEVTKIQDSFQTQEVRFKAQIEDLRFTTQSRRFSPNALISGRRASLDHTSSPISPNIASNSNQSPSVSDMETPPPPSRLSPTHAEESSHEEKQPRLHVGSLRGSRTLEQDSQIPDVAQQLEKALKEAGAANQEILKEKDLCIDELTLKIAELQNMLNDEKQKAIATDQRYHLLLKSEDLKMPAHVRTPMNNVTDQQSHVTTHESYQFNGYNDGIKSIDILIIGDSLSGKSQLMDKLINEHGRTNLSEHPTLDFGAAALLRHHRITFKSHTLVIAELLENSSADIIKDWAFKSRYLIIIYDLSAESSYRHATQYVKMTSQHPYRLCFGNRMSLENGVAIDVNLADVKDYAARSNCAAAEGSNLADVLEGIWMELDKLRIKSKVAHQRSGMENKAQIRLGIPSGTVAPGSGASLSSFISRIHSYFGSTDKLRFDNEMKNNILRPSTTETLAPRRPGGGTQLDGCLHPVTELPDNPAAITCVAFGREKEQREFYLLAAACKDGSITIYRVYRTETEKQMWDSEVATPSPIGSVADATSVVPDTNVTQREGKVEIVTQLFGHSRAITHLFFTYKEDQLVSTSIDKSVRFWSLETGDMLKVFADSTSCLVAAFLPSNPSLFIVGNANSILRVVDVRNGKVIQKLRAESEVRAIKFDETGLYCYAGTRNGMLHVLESSDSGDLQFKFKIKLSKCSITCITHVPSTGLDIPPQLFVNSCDSTITIVDCIYSQPTGTLSTLLARHRVKVVHSLLPLRSCYSAAGGGWLISASEDRNVYIYNLAPSGNYRNILLRRHQAPVVTVAVNQQNTVLASADSCGKIILWRWIQYKSSSDSSVVNPESIGN